MNNIKSFYKNKINQTINMVKQLKLLSLFEKLVLGIATSLAITFLTSGLIMWKSIAVQASKQEEMQTKIIYIENNYVRNDFKDYLELQFKTTNGLIIDNKEQVKKLEERINKHMGI